MQELTVDTLVRVLESLIEVKKQLVLSRKVIDAARSYHAAVALHDKEFLMRYHDLGVALDEYDQAYGIREA